jgi:hypothetical protein
MHRFNLPLRVLALILCLTVLGQACATMGSPGQAAMFCGAGGALAGAAVGAASAKSNRLAGALIGAAIGGLLAATACFAIAEYKSQQVKGYQDTQQAVNYKPDQGNVGQITTLSVNPSPVAPGNSLAIDATYYVMTPKGDEDVQVVETRTLKKYNPTTTQYEEMGRSDYQVTMKPGTQNASGKFSVGSNLPPGGYAYAFKIQAAGQTDEKEVPFLVTQDPNQLKTATVAQVVSEPIGMKSASTSSAPAVAPAAPTPPTATGEAPPTSTPETGKPLASIGEAQPAPPTAVAPATTAEKHKYFIVTKVATTGSVREGPGTSFKVIGQVSKNDRYLLLDTTTPKGSKASWHKIRLDNGQIGWVSSTLGTETEPE